MRIGIVTDSTCDLPPKTLAKHPVVCIPTEVCINGEAYVDWQDIDAVTLYQMMLTDDTAAFSTQPGHIEMYVNAYRIALQQYDYVIGLHISNKLSQVFELATEAVDTLNAHNRVKVIDTTYVNAGLAAPVLGASRMIQQGGNLDDVLDEIDRICNNTLFLFSPRTMKWLVAYGRTPALAAAFANLLGLRPLITVNGGMAQRYGMVRANQTLAKLVEEIEKVFGRTPINLTFGTAGVVPTTTAEFKRLVAESKLKVSHARLQMIGPSVGISVGPGAVSVAAYPTRGEIFDIELE